MKVSLVFEISEKYLKIVVVKFKGMQLKIFDCIVEPLNDSTDERIADLIIDILKKNRYKPKVVGISLPRNFVTVRNLHLPSQNNKEISNMIELHIDRIVPYKKEDVIFNYNFSGKDEMGYSRVILSIVHNDIIRRQIRILDRAGFLLDRISLSSYGVWQNIYNNYRSHLSRTDLYLILDVDTTFTDFIIFSADNMLFTRNITMKTSDIYTELGGKKFLGEIKQSLLIFQNEEINKKPAKIFISGASNLQLAQVIKEEMDINVEITENAISKDLLHLRKRTVPLDVSLTSVLSLVLENKDQRLSFILPDIQIRKSIREKIRDLSVCGTLAIYMLSLVCIIFLGQIYNQENYLKKLNDHYYKIEKEVGDLVWQLDNIEFVKKYLSNRQIPLYVINQLQKIIPKSISLNFIGMDEAGKLTLRGQAYQLSEVFQLTTDLDKRLYFKDAQTRSTQQRKLKDKEITDFEISFIFDVKKQAAGYPLP